jgi:acetyl-CoA C-acetyltransferase
MAVDPRTPVVVGVGQTEQHVDDPAEALEPIDLLSGAVRVALDDAGAARTLAVDTIGIVQIISWPYADPGALLGRQLGLDDVRATAVTTVGGNSPQLLLTTLAHDIARGDADVVVVGGAECMRTRWRARREPKVWLPWTETDDPPCPRVLGDDRVGSSEYELAHQADAPIHVYPLLETALRAAAGRSVVDHQAHIGALWARFAAVSAANPHAWSRTAYSATEIVDPSPDNRIVTFPYTKRMCANMGVDQAAALVLCSYEAARTAGVPDDRMVFPLSGADAHDHFFFTERDRLAAAPGMATAAAAACDAAGVAVDDIARFDLYSCFPSAVQLAMDALGLDGTARGDDRPLTVTGGLAFAGGPTNDYSTHAIAAMVDACRADPGSVGYVSALGWYATKHSVGLYSTTPPASGFVRVDPARTQATVDATPRRSVAGPYDGPADVEATAVIVDRDGRPSRAVLSAITPDGTRALANSADVGVLTSMMQETWEGRSVHLATDGTANELRA